MADVKAAWDDYPQHKLDSMWEYLNYFLALLMLAVIGAFYRLRIAGYRARYRQLLDS